LARTLAILTLVTLGVAASYAGPLMLGGPNGLQTAQAAGNIVDSSNSTPLPYSATVLQGTGSSASNTITSGLICRGYAATTASDCTGHGGTVSTSLPYTSSAGSQYAATASNGVTFAMINQASLPNASVWTTSANATPTTSTITIPMGIFGVTDIYTMMNDNFGIQGEHPGSPVSVQFNFSTGSENFVLVNGTVIRDSWDCLAGLTANGCLNYQTGGVDKLDTTNTYNESGTTAATAGPTVTAFNVLTAAYLNTTAGVTQYKGTSGNIYLDAQHFAFGGRYAGATLNNIVITDTITTGAQSRVELSAIDYQQAPEPAAFVLSGLGILFVASLRRKFVRGV
jgi:hypothetical protein